MSKTRKDTTRQAYRKQILTYLGYEIPNNEDELWRVYYDIWRYNWALYEKTRLELGYSFGTRNGVGYKNAKKWSKGARRAKERSIDLTDEDRAYNDDFRKGKRKWGKW